MNQEDVLKGGRPPLAFLSYSWESEDHREWVLQLATRLQRDDGVEVILDRWHLLPGQDKTVFMENGIARSDFVILVTTPVDSKRADDRTGGVGYEAMIISGALAEKIDQKKFIPVLRNGDWTSSLPIWIKSRLGVDLRGNPYSETSYHDLLRALHQEPLRPPPIGPKPVFSKAQHSEPLSTPQEVKEALFNLQESVELLRREVRMASGHYKEVSETGALTELSAEKAAWPPPPPSESQRTRPGSSPKSPKIPPIRFYSEFFDTKWPSLPARVKAALGEFLARLQADPLSPGLLKSAQRDGVEGRYALQFFLEAT